jgi:diaminohydroxyphosphoribosylaminopyrimidine deaminase/5-amino-6-(5-phosphoribosylamino)uracil reductase
MRLAIKAAWENITLTYPNPSVGAVILDMHGKILAIQATQKAGKAHAELHAITQALITLGDATLPTLHSAKEQHAYILSSHHDRLKGATIYVTLEPCNHTGKTPPCSLLIEKLGFSQLICGIKDPNTKATGALQGLKNAGVSVTSGVMQEACEVLLTPFKRWQAKKPFIFFKLALSANGVYDGGTITSLTSRTLVHQMRDKVDLLIIGGETVRQDRPTLDSRLVGGKAPDILILSKHKDFDKSIPLFKVPNRQVFIEENFDKITSYQFIMIEGGEAMLRMTIMIVDWYCIFYASHFKEGKTIQITQDLQRLAQLENKHDTITWFQTKDI